MAAGMWAPFKELATTVHMAIAMKQPQAYYRLESMLKKHRPDFTSLLKNPPRTPSHRSRVEKSTKEGLVVSSISQSLLLPQDFIDEALILSDILDLNELTAVELLLAGEQHQPDFPTLSRGLVAVLLYYDGRRNLVTSLRSLIQAREGISWTLGLSSNVVALVTNFTDGLFKDSLVEKILQLLKEINVEKELEKLAEGKAIKDAQHKQQIVDLIDETKYALADCLFYWACQNPFPQATILKVLKELKQLPATNEGHQQLNYIHLSLFFTLLVSFQVGDSTQDAPSLDSSLIDEHYPLIVDTNSVPAIHKAITKKEKIDKDNRSNPALEAAVKFAWAVFLRECSSLEAFKEECNVLEEDEQLVDIAVEAGAFQFLRQAVVNSSFFFQEEYYVRCLHQLLTKFIHLMPVKITELRNRGDEVAREEMMRMVRGAPPTPKLQQNFGELMKLVGDIYYKDPNNLNLSLEYWPSIEMDSQFSQSSQALQHRQLSLYKFIHQCSDLLPPSLFHPFMYMLIGLSSSPQTAHQCFNFLKSNSPSLGGGGPSAVISFDHFFHSLRQYYLGLRQGAGPKHTPTGCAISPQELDGLLVVLKLVTVIADQDKDARVVIYDNQTWLPVASLFGLIGCPISRQLKTQIFLTLAAFAKTPDIAATMWNILEVSQVLNTSPVSGNISGTQFGLAPIQQEGSLQIELEEFESAAEEYSETRAFLTLLDSLTDIPVSGYLGADHRVPGFQPYLEFIRDVVFLKFDSRGYKDPQEKWMVASGALKILHKLLANHEISSDDLIEQQHEISQGRFVLLPKQPGFTILLHLLNDSALLRKLLCIVDECCHLLSDVESCTDKVANTALLALKTLETALSKQDEFLTILRSNSAHSVMATPLDDLLLGINPRSRKADHYVNIARYITFSSCSPELALTAVRILYLASHSPSVAREIINSLTSDRDICSTVLHGFVEHLEFEESYFEPHPPDSEQDMEGGGGDGEINHVRRQLKEDIINLLILCVSKPTLNIAHLLLGFLEIQDTPRGRLKKISETILQDPGVLGSPKNCLHAILSLIQIGADPSNPIGCHYTHPKLAESCYHLIYLLCDNRELSQSTLRYLRNNHDYFYSQLLHIPFPWLLESQEVDDITKMYYSQQAWILRSVAIELRMTSLNNLRSHTQRLVTLLLKSSATLTHQLNEFDYSMTSQVTAWTDMDHSTDPSLMEDGRRKILVLLDLLSLSGIELPPLQLQYFDQSRTEEVIESCETKDTLGREGAVTYVNVKLLHRLLMNELNSLQGAVAVSQKPFIIKEIHTILGVVVERNRIQEILHCRQFLMESWQQLVEILVGVVNEEGRERLRITVLFELIQDLLLKIEEYNDTNSLTAAAQSVVFTLMSHLRQSLQTLLNQSDQIDQTLAPISTGPLQSILRGLLDNLLRCPSGMQRLRAYLYATLLCYLHMTQDREAKVQTFRGGLWRLEHDATGLASANLNIFSGCGEGLMDTVCRDACSGHDIAKMLALSILDSILCLDKHSTWLKYMVSRGYLQTICASLQQDDESLQNLLQPLPIALRPIYVYESKMAFMIRVASTSLGARELVTKNCVAMLSECRFIDSRPVYHGNTTSIPSNAAGFIPSVSSRYLQLFLPVLRFLITLLTTSGSQQIEASSQVVDFIATHTEVFASVLKESHTCVSMATLQELSLVAAVISQCRAGHDWSLDVSNPHTARLLCLQNLIMSLLPYYCLPSHWKQVAQEVVKNEEGCEVGGSGRSSVGGTLWEEAFSLSQRVCASLVSYCQNAMSIGGTEFSAQYSRIIFTPDLSQPINATGGLSGDRSSSSPSLALLVTALKEICDSYYSVLETSQQLKKKMENLKELTSEEMKQLLSDISQDDKTEMTPSQLQQLVRAALQRLLASKQQQLTNFLYIVEHLLYILWRHLQFYLVHCRPMKLSNEYGIKGMADPRDPTMRRLQDTGNKSIMTGQHDSKSSGFDLSNLSTGITENDLEQLRLNAVKSLTDTMFKKLLDLSESHPSTKETMTIRFINALVRRMRKLIKLKAAAKPVLQL